MKRAGRPLLATLLLAGLLPGARAQEIIWGAPQNIKGDTDVVTNGTPVYAYDFANNGEAVNGINFSGASSANAGGNVGTTLTTFNNTAYTSTANPFAALSPAYNGILVGAAYALTSVPYTVTLSNLVSGHAYAVQFWVNDPRGLENGRAVQLSSLGGNTVVLENSTATGSTAGYPGQYSVGQFTNYGAPQTFTLQTAGTSLDAALTALQVLDLGQVQTPNVGYWNGLGGSTLGFNTLDFSTNAATSPLGTAASLATLQTFASPALFADTYANNSALIPVTATNITIAAGGITNGEVEFVNTNVAYTINSADSKGITGATTVGVSGSGTVTLAGANTYSGGTVIADGTLQVGAAGTSGSLGSGPVANYASLVFDRSDNPVFANVISGVGSITQAGSGTLTLSNSIIGGPLTTLSQTGAGSLVLSGSNTFGGNLIIGQGTVNVNGSGPGGSPSTSLYVGGNTGVATLNFNTTGTWTVGTLGGNFIVGGTGLSSDTSAGAFNMSAGTVNFSDGAYFTLGNGSGSCYGSFTQSGGTFTVINNEGVRIGEGGLGSWLQTGGTFVSERYFVIGGNGGSGPANEGVATFLGGATTLPTGYYLILGNTSGAYGMMNIGTEAGGNATFTAPDATGPEVGQSGGATGVLNLNSGTLLVNGAITTSSGGTGTINLNGGTLEAGANNTLIAPSVTSVNVYNGGLTVNDQAFTNLISASLPGTTGHGIYPAHGIFAITSGGGSGYIGAPLVTVSGGSGAGALAIATVANGVVTNVTITCPGENYRVGDAVSFAFAGGGATNPVNSFNYTLTAGDLATNGTGGLTKIGSGQLTLSAANTYTGSTIVGGGNLAVTVDGGLGQGNVVVANGASLTLEDGVTNGYISTTADLALNPTATANLNYTGSNLTINGLSTNGGLAYLPPGVYGAPGSGAPNVLSQLTGTGLITVVSTPVVNTVQVSLIASPNPAEVGQSVTLTATVSGSGAIPSGTVTFLEGGVALGSGTLNNFGVATFTTNFPAIGSVLLTATYSGNGHYSAATSLVPVGETVNPRLDIWTGAKSSIWDIATTSNWFYLTSAALYHDGDAVRFDDTAAGSTAISLSVTVKPNFVLFTNTAKSYSLSGSGAISGAASLTLAGGGALTVNTTNNYTGNTVVSNGVLTFNGGSTSTGGGILNVGAGTGVGVLNMNSSGTLTFGGTVSVGGLSGDTNDVGNGAIYQTEGTNNFGNNSSDIYMELGTGGTNAYGFYDLSGGTFNILNASGLRIGSLGFGVFVQSAGTMNLSRYMAFGTLSGGGDVGGTGVATLTGGTAAITGGYRVILGDRPGGIGILNIGTEAGGSNSFSPGSIEIFGDAASSNAVVNLNSGTLAMSGDIYYNGGSGDYAVNLNGGTFQATADLGDLLDSTLYNVVLYNGGVVFDTQDFGVTNFATISGATGDGIYPAGGIIKVTSGGGSNYIGAPYVSVLGGSGSGALAVATVVNGVVTNVVLTCPGQNYLAGDVISFAFAGGTATPAPTFNYTLTSADVTANGSGKVTKIGAGTLVMNESTAYTNATVVSNGTLEVDGGIQAGVVVNGGLLNGSGSVGGAVIVHTGGAIGAGDAANIGQLNLSGTLALAGTVSLRVDKTGGSLSSDTIAGLPSLAFAGALVVANFTSDDTLLAAGDTFTLFSAGSYSGSFSSINLPTLPGGLTWNLSSLGVNGAISVASAPSISSITVNGTTLTLTATNGTAGGQFVLLGTTNLALPLSQWTPIWANTFDGNGDVSVSTNIVNRAAHQEFYILSQ